MRTFDILLGTLLVLVGLAGAAVVFTRDPKRQALISSFFAATLVLLFFALQSPDVALSELVIGMVILPTMYLLTLARLERTQR
jgi:uncharacterized MnhB-related membrane protein